jgi:DNA-binding NarL/FixJ family response regulator
MFAHEIAYYEDKDRDLNYAALALAVYGGGDISPDYAVAQIQSRSTSDRARKTAQTLEMVRLAERGYSYMTIARMMGLKSDSTVWQRVKNWREKHESDI